MLDIKSNFTENEWDMIQHILTNGKTTTWWELANRFGIKPGEDTAAKTKRANDIWRRFNGILGRNSLDFVTVKQTLDKHGEIISLTQKRQPEEIPSLMIEGLEIQKMTTNAYGGAWTSYVKKEKEAVNILESVERLLDKYIVNKQRTSYSFPLFSTPGKKLGIVNLFDAHLDKIPIKSTCGVETTVEQNIEVFLNTVDRICGELVRQDVDEIVFPVGNDLFHTNGFNSQTKKGTQIEYYGSPEDNYYIICDAITEAVTRLAVVAKKTVKVIMIKGNHDEDKVTVLGYWLERMFKGTNVEVDYLRKQRKYIQFGKNLIGFAHGDKEKQKMAQLPLIMATEAKELWGNTVYRKMYLGDLHHGFEFQFLKAKDHPGVEVEYLRSVGTTDSWHEDFGWIGIPKTAYLQIFDIEEGEVVRQKFNIR